ncbi:MAG: NADP-dependent phosphogluconate dehydrogenase [Planctomycetes bacterium]|nr:NADP-dependent phosphogluconate dehydrogenase [Planctomycetota bacterium]
MGQNLALNIARRGFRVAVFNRSFSRTEELLGMLDGEPLQGHAELAAMVQSLQRPRKVILMVKAGEATEATLAQLLPLLSPGDIVVDGGNAHPDDSERRSKQLTARGLRFVGMGVSGGEEGALHGPSLMPGGPRDAYDELAPILTRIAAEAEGEPCVTYIGPGGAGHFVKMVHNGIEYGDMQLIAETFDLLREGLDLEPRQQAEVFAGWNRGPLESFLIEITADILGQTDEETGQSMVDVIVDAAGQKGTGRWTAELALAHGVPLPTIHAAVDARGLSSRRAERQAASAALRGPERRAVECNTADVEAALYASKICSYAQGMDLLQQVGRASGWDLDLAAIARIWRGGCIIRARFLDRIAAAFTREPGLDNLLRDGELGGFLAEHQAQWRRVVAAACARGVPVLAMAASLSYFDSYRRSRLPQSLTQAQRDYFGAHTFERVDRPAGEFFHREWSRRG